jgi:hypothetical protein
VGSILELPSIAHVISEISGGFVWRQRPFVRTGRVHRYIGFEFFIDDLCGTIEAGIILIKNPIIFWMIHIG